MFTSVAVYTGVAVCLLVWQCVYWCGSVFIGVAVFTGVTLVFAGVTLVFAGVTLVCAGVTLVCAGVTLVFAGVTFIIIRLTCQFHLKCVARLLCLF